LFFLRGSALERRLRERQKEKEVDSRDRAKEKEELEDIRRKLLEEGHPDLEAEMAKVNFIHNYKVIRGGVRWVP
jgi:RNA-binding protein 25